MLFCFILLTPDPPFVRREKVSIFSGCNSHPATVVPAGSNRAVGSSLPKHPMERSVERFREPAGRNVSER